MWLIFTKILCNFINSLPHLTPIFSFSTFIPSAETNIPHLFLCKFSPPLSLSPQATTSTAEASPKLPLSVHQLLLSSTTSILLTYSCRHRNWRKTVGARHLLLSLPVSVCVCVCAAGPLVCVRLSKLLGQARARVLAAAAAAAAEPAYARNPSSQPSARVAIWCGLAGGRRAQVNG